MKSMLLRFVLFMCCWLSGCNALPTVTPEGVRSAASSQPQPQLQGAKGPLSVAQSKAILDRLAASGGGATLLERHIAFEEAVVDSPLTAGNKVILLQDGPATYKAMLAAIASAKDHINMETYILDDDEVGAQFAQALIAKQRAGVQVNLIRDSVGTFKTPAEFFKNLSNEGIKVLEFNPVNPLAMRVGWSLNQRDHRKLLIVDGHTALLGGINISSVYSGSSALKRRNAENKSPAELLAWRDTDIQLQGPVVAELQKLFMAQWAVQKGDPLPPKNYFPQPQRVGNQIVRAIGSSPTDEYSQIYVTLLSAIAHAEETIYLTNAYFVPDPQLLTALEDAVKRGVKVKLILPSQSDAWIVLHAGRSYYDRLLRSGVKIYERRGVILHAKTALIDGVWATIGSTNLDWRSFLHNYELNAVVLGEDFGNQVQTMFNKDLAQSDEITLEKWQNRSFNLRMKEWLAQLWEYWL